MERQLDHVKAETQKISLMEKGVYTEEACDLCRILVNAGCSQDLVGNAMVAILAAVGLTIKGPSMSKRTVARSILEGGIMADIQLGHEISKVDSLTVSSDGTTHKHVNFESRHVNMKVPTYGSNDDSSVQHQSRLIGVDSATDHSAQTQADGWKKKIDDLLHIYDQSPIKK